MTVSSELKTAAWAQASRLPLICLEITHADLAQPIRVVNNTEPVVLAGVEYTAFGFDIGLPDNLEDAPPRARLRIDNVSREIAQNVRSITSPATVNIKVCRVVDAFTDDFTATPGNLPSGYTFSRASIPGVLYDGSYIDSAGNLQDAAASAPRWTYSPTIVGTLVGFLNEPQRTNLKLDSMVPKSGTGDWLSLTSITLSDASMMGATVKKATGSPVLGGSIGGTMSKTPPAVAGQKFVWSFYAIWNSGRQFFNLGTLMLGGSNPGNNLTDSGVLLSLVRRFEQAEAIDFADRTGLFMGPTSDLGASAYDLTHGFYQYELVSDVEEHAASSWIRTTGTVLTRAGDVLTRTELADGLYDITIVRNGTADEVLTGVSVSGGSYLIPQSVYPLQSVTFTPADATGPVVDLELEFPGMRLDNVSIDALTVEGQLQLENLVREPFPARIFSPAEFPGLVQ